MDTISPSGYDIIVYIVAAICSIAIFAKSRIKTKPAEGQSEKSADFLRFANRIGSIIVGILIFYVINKIH